MNLPLDMQAMPTRDASPTELVDGVPTELVDGAPTELVGGAPTELVDRVLICKELLKGVA